MMKKTCFVTDISLKSQTFPLLSENLSHLMMVKKVSLTQLSRSTHIAMPTLKRLQTDPTANPTISTLLPVARFFGIQVEQLVSDKVKDLHQSESFGQIKVPLITWSGAIQYSDTQIRGSQKWITTDTNIGKLAFALTVIADDWLGMPKGSVLIVDPEKTPTNRHFVLLYREGMQTPTIKQQVDDENRSYYRSLNPLLPLVAKDDQHRVLGVVVQARYL